MVNRRFIDLLSDALVISLGIAIYECLYSYIDMLFDVAQARRIARWAEQARAEQEQAEQAEQAKNQENSQSRTEL